MIIHLIIIRTHDGLPLSVTTDGKYYKEVSLARTCIKLISRKANELKERCTIFLDAINFVIHYIASYGISYMVICEKSYPPLLAFSFLEDIKQEFISAYNINQVNAIRRPYSFIEFDDSTVKIRQRYNSPKNISPRIQLSQLSEELRIHPPDMLQLGYSNSNDLKFEEYKQKEEEHWEFNGFSPWNFFVYVISFLVFLFSFYRGIIFCFGYEILDDTDRSHARLGTQIILEAFSIFSQVFVFYMEENSDIQSISPFISNKKLALFPFMLVLICNFLLYNIKTWFQILINLLASAALYYLTIIGKSKCPASKCNV